MTHDPNTICRWCGHTYQEHFNEPPADMAVKTPCGMLKETFLPYPAAIDVGHKNLMDDLAALVAEADAFEFHDFKNEKYPSPKMTFRLKLRMLEQNAAHGKYDNEAN